MVLDRILLSVLSFVLGTLFRTISPPLSDWAQARVVRFVAEKGWKIGTNSRMGGHWNHSWYAKGSTSWPDENNCSITLSMIGKRFAGFYVYRDQNWLVEGALGADNVVTGTWRQLPGNGYRGTWIGKADLSLQTLTGWYLGTSSRGPTGVGEWIWWRDNAVRPPLPEPLVQPAPRPEKLTKQTP